MTTTWLGRVGLATLAMLVALAGYVRLGSPVGDREIVDGACQNELWADNPLCQRAEVIVRVG